MDSATNQPLPFGTLGIHKVFENSSWKLACKLLANQLNGSLVDIVLILMFYFTFRKPNFKMQRFAMLSLISYNLTMII